MVGLASGVSFLILFGISIAMHPTFRFGRDFPSDLGVGDYGFVFNSAILLIGCGGLILIWWGLRPMLRRGILTWISPLLMLIAALIGLSLAYFTVDSPSEHHLLTNVAFELGIVGLFLLLPSFLKAPGLGWPVFIAGCAAISATAYLFIDSNGGAETLAVLAILLWMIVTSFRIMNADHDSGRTKSVGVKPRTSHSR